ncbi:MAG: hypothetical protein WC756_20795 [Taibaiella sp.]|jgi:hypothetical protein
MKIGPKFQSEPFMKLENITSDSLVSIAKDHIQYRELIADSNALEYAIKIRTPDGWDLFMLAALYQTSGRYADLINAVSVDALNAAMLNISDQDDHILLLTLYFQTIENFKLLKDKISQPVLGEALLFLAQQCMSADFQQLVNAVGLDDSNLLMKNALTVSLPRAASKSYSIKLLGCNLSLDTLNTSIQSGDNNAKIYEIMGNLSPFKLNELLKFISEKSFNLLGKVLNEVNSHALTKAVLVSEQGNNLIMLMLGNKNKSPVIFAWIDFLYKINVLNRVAVKVNQNKENLLIIALRHPEKCIIQKLIALVHITVLQKTLLSLLVNGSESAFNAMWDLLDEKLRIKVLIDAVKFASAIELKIFVDKLCDSIIEMLLSISNDEFIFLVSKVEPQQLADLLLLERINREKLIVRWCQLSQKTLFLALKTRNENNSNVLMRLPQTLESTAFSNLVSNLSKENQLIELACEVNNHGQDVLMFSAYHQDASSFLLLAQAIQKENKLDELAVKRDGNGNTALNLLSQRKSLKIFSLFLGMLSSDTFMGVLPFLFQHVKKVDIEEKSEKIAIAHILKIHHHILKQNHDEDEKAEDIIEINKSRGALKDLSFTKMTQILEIYEDCFSSLTEEKLFQCNDAIKKVKQILSTPYAHADSSSGSAFSSIISWLSGNEEKNENIINNKVMQHMGEKSFK